MSRRRFLTISGVLALVAAGSTLFAVDGWVRPSLLRSGFSAIEAWWVALGGAAVVAGFTAGSAWVMRAAWARHANGWGAISVLFWLMAGLVAAAFWLTVQLIHASDWMVLMGVASVAALAGLGVFIGFLALLRRVWSSTVFDSGCGHALLGLGLNIVSILGLAFLFRTTPTREWGDLVKRSANHADWPTATIGSFTSAGGGYRIDSWADGWSQLATRTAAWDNVGGEAIFVNNAVQAACVLAPLDIPVGATGSARHAALWQGAAKAFQGLLPLDTLTAVEEKWNGVTYLVGRGRVEVAPLRGPATVELWLGNDGPRGVAACFFAPVGRAEWIDVEARKIVMRLQFEHVSSGVLASAVPLGSAVLLPSSKDLPSLRSEAEKAFQAGDYPAAARLWRRACGLDPSSAELVEKTVAAHAYAGDCAAALDWLETHRGLTALSPVLDAWAARLKLRLNQADAAEAKFDALFRNGWDDEGDLKEYLNFLVARGRVAKAEQTAEDFVRAHPTRTARRFLATLYGQSGQPAKGADLLSDVWQAEPVDRVTAYKFAELCNEAGRFREAESVVKTLSQGGDSSLRLRLLDGWTQLMQGRTDQASAAFMEARKLSPDDKAVAEAFQALAKLR